MSAVLSIILVCGVVLGLAVFWMTYLIKIVLNDEEVHERIRRIQRKREEARRQMEDRVRKQHADRQGISSDEPEAAAASPGPATPQTAIAALGAAADKAEQALEKKG